MRTDLPATWFRLYAEFAHDPKVQMLSEIDQRRFIVVMCLRCCNGSVTLHDSEVAFQLRISDNEWMTTKALLLAKNLIGDDNKPVAWEKRQFDSDTSNERVSRYREKRKQERNVTVTPMKQKCNGIETEKETEGEKKKRYDAQAHLLKLGVSISVVDDWLQLRKQKKAAVTATAIRGIETEADKAGMSLEKALSECCSRGWTGFKAEWIVQKKTTGESREDTIAGLCGTSRKIADIRDITGESYVINERMG